MVLVRNPYSPEVKGQKNHLSSKVTWATSYKFQASLVYTTKQNKHTLSSLLSFYVCISKHRMYSVAGSACLWPGQKSPCSCTPELLQINFCCSVHTVRPCFKVPHSKKNALRLQFTLIILCEAHQKSIKIRLHLLTLSAGTAVHTCNASKPQHL